MSTKRFHATTTARRKQRQSDAFAEYRKRFPNSPVTDIRQLGSRLLQVLVENHKAGWPRRLSQTQETL